MDDVDFMREAFREAQKAYDNGECPVGAVLVRNGEIIARAGNQELLLRDPTAHAEILALRKAGQVLDRHKFPDCTMYTTLWPCPMCDNALLQAELPRVISGARTFKWIAETRFNSDNLTRIGPIMEKACRAIFSRWLVENGRYEILEREELGEDDAG